MSPEILKQPNLDLGQVNNEFAELELADRVARANELFAGRIILPTTFGPTAPVMLEAVTKAIPDITVINIRHGHETERTLELAEYYRDELELDLRLYEAPRLTVPKEGTPDFEEFQRKIKVEPFQRALDDLKPLAYFSGVMRWQTTERQSMPFVQNKGSVFAINPVLDLTEEDVSTFFERTGLPRNDDYFDPTKGEKQKNECQLNLAVYR